MSPARRLLPLLLCACALLIVGCGGSETQPTRFIAKSTAAKLQTTLDAVEQDVAADRCDQAASGVTRMRAQVGDFPTAYDDRLVANVSQWIDHLEDRLATDCGEPEAEDPTPSPSPSPTETAEPEETAEPDETATPDDTPEPSPTASPEPSPTAEPEAPDPAPTAPPLDDLDGTGGAPGEDGG